MKEAQRVAATPARLKEAMEAMDKNQLELAHETGLSHSTISRYLSGKVEPRQAAIIKLAAALNVSEWWLWGYDVDKTRRVNEKEKPTVKDDGLTESQRKLIALAEGMSDDQIEALIQMSEAFLGRK